MEKCPNCGKEGKYKTVFVNGEKEGLFECPECGKTYWADEMYELAKK